ncbi:BatA and WFA domain-containing protein [bacterium]|nr:BatA and WFA domain-containing protein [bacterium]
MLQFLNYSMLLGLAGASIPILIHLLSRRHRVLIPFSTLRFFKALEPRTLSWLRLKQRLLLLLRTLILAMLALALSHPYWRDKANKGPGSPGAHNVAIILDQSLSMQAGGRWNEAKDMVNTFLKSQNDRDQYALFSMITPEETIIDISPVEIMNRIKKVQPRWQSGSPGDIVSSASKWLSESSASGRELVVISDFQHPDWPAAIADSNLSDCMIYAMPVHDLHSNLAITQFRLKTLVYQPGMTVKVEVMVSNYSTVPAEGILIRIQSNDDVVAQKQINLDAEAHKIISFEIASPGAGWWRLLASIETDDFVQDNRRYLSLQIPEDNQILLISGDLAVSAPIILALNAAGYSTDESRLSIREAKKVWLQELSNKKVVILHNVRDMDQFEVEALSAFIKDGGGLFIIPGDKSNLRFWDSNVTSPWNIAHIGAVLHGRGGILKLGAPPVSSSFFKGLYTEGHRKFVSPEFYRLLDMQNLASNVLLSTENGYPWLMQHSIGSGRILLLASDISTAWTDLVHMPFFAFLMHRSIFFLSAHRLETASSFYPGETVQIPTYGEIHPEMILLESPSGEWLIPHVESVNGGERLMAGRAEMPGFYTLMQRDTILSVVSINTDPVESDLRAQQRASFNMNNNSAGLRWIDSVQEIDRVLEMERSGISFVPWIWFFISLLVVTEMLLAGSIRQKS